MNMDGFMNVSGIHITHHPWMAGMRLTALYGTICIKTKVQGKSWEEGIDGALEAAAAEVRELGGNALVGMEMHCDPYHSDGGHIRVIGSSARFEPLFAGIEVGHP